MVTVRRLLPIITLCIVVIGVVADTSSRGPRAIAAVGEDVIGLGDDGTTLVRFDSAFPGTILATPIGGLAAGETVLGIDVRPATGQLHALTSTGRIVVVDPDAGFVVRTVTLVADP